MLNKNLFRDLNIIRVLVFVNREAFGGASGFMVFLLERNTSNTRFGNIFARDVFHIN
jgi:hypothetical protein